VSTNTRVDTLRAQVAIQCPAGTTLFTAASNVFNVGAGGEYQVGGVQISLANIVLTYGTVGFELLRGTGVDSSGGDKAITLTGAAVGQRVLGVFGSVTATGAPTVDPLIPGTDVEATISTVDELLQLKAAGDLSANTYQAILGPALVT